MRIMKFSRHPKQVPIQRNPFLCRRIANDVAILRHLLNWTEIKRSQKTSLPDGASEHDFMDQCPQHVHTHKQAVYAFPSHSMSLSKIVG